MVARRPRLAGLRSQRSQGRILPGALKQALARTILRTSGLPSLGPVEPPTGAGERLAAAADALLERGELPREIPLLTLLRWLAARRGVLFHGSSRGDLTVLEPIRRTRDASPFGDQEAVFAASDPVWAIYFAILGRGDDFRSTRNGSFGFPEALYPRWYYFSHNEGAKSEGRFGNGWLYVLPRDDLQREPLALGVFDTGQWASLSAVRPLVRIPVSAADFPFADRVVSHRLEEGMWRTVLRAAARGRRSAVEHR